MMAVLLVKRCTIVLLRIRLVTDVLVLLALANCDLGRMCLLPVSWTKGACNFCRSSNLLVVRRENILSGGLGRLLVCDS